MKSMKFLAVAALMLAAAQVVSAEGYIQYVCQSTGGSTESYEIDETGVTGTMNYAWKFTGGTEGTDFETTKVSDTQYTIKWVSKSTAASPFVISTQATDAVTGCKGPIQTIDVIVNAKPVVSDTEATLCSYVATEQPDVLGYTLPEKDADNNAITKWIIKSSTVPTGVTPSTTFTAGQEITDKTAMENITYVNTNTTKQDVVYTITPVGGCTGDDYTLTVHVQPQVKAPVMKSSTTALSAK